MEQDASGARRASRTIQGQTETFRREAAAPRFVTERVEAPQTGDRVGQRELQPGEFEVQVPRLVRDLNGDGIPDGAQVTVSRELPGGMKMSARFVKNGSDSSGGIAPAPLRGEASGPSIGLPGLRGEALNRALGVGVQQDQSGLAKDARRRLDEAGARSPLNRNTIEGMRVPELLRREDMARDSEALQAGTALGVAERQFVVPAQERTRQVGAEQRGLNLRAGTAAVVQREAIGARKEIEQAKLTQAATEFNAKNRETPLRFESDPQTGARVAVLGNVMMRVEETQQGFLKLSDPATGKPRLVMNEDGDIVTFDPTTGEPVVDRRPLADKLGGMPGLSTASPTAQAPVTRGPNQKKGNAERTNADYIADLNLAR
jgi:hypothetical protein